MVYVVSVDTIDAHSTGGGTVPREGSIPVRLSLELSSGLLYCTVLYCGLGSGQ